MSENTTAPSGEVEIREDRNGVILTLNVWGDKGKFKGFSFYEKSFKSLEIAREHFKSLGEDGDSIITSLLNKSLSAMARAKAGSKLPVDEDAIAKLRDQGGDNLIVISSEEAYKYIPGERDAWSIPGLNKKLNDIRAALKTARAEGNEDTSDIVVNLKAEGKELVEKIRVAQEKLNDEFAD